MNTSGIAKRKARGHAGQRGAAMVEFALIFILLFTVITLIAEGGFLFGAWLAATNGAREGARYGAPCLNRVKVTSTGTIDVDRCTLAEVQAIAADRANGFPGDFTVLPPVISGTSLASGGTGTVVTVTVEAAVSSIAPILGDITVYGQSTMRLENQ